jgi:hypothetical protein
MNTIANIETISAGVSLPGCKFSRTGLLIDTKASDEQLTQIGNALVTIEGSRSWWIGDYGCALQRRKGEAYTEGRAEVLGIEPGSFRVYKCTADFFPVLSRLNALSFGHHYEAMVGADGDLAVAQNWLGLAEKNEWSVSELRKEIRATRAEYKPDGQKPTGNGYSALLDANRYASSQMQELESYTSERAAAILEDNKQLAQYLAQLAEIVRRGAR